MTKPSDVLIDMNGIKRSYALGKDRHLPVLLGLDLQVEHGDFIALMGPSGSGKSTLMNIIGCLDQSDGGQYLLQGRDVSSMSDRALSHVRGQLVGFVFQFFNLIPQLNVRENVALPLFYQGVSKEKRERLAEESLERVSLSHRIDHRPQQLSGGEMQRAAIARSLISKPPLLVADEPTGNLDSRTGATIMELFHDLHKEGMTIVMVTHDADVGKQAGRMIHMRDGRITP